MSYKGYGMPFNKKYEEFIRNEERFEDLVDLSDPKKFFVDLDEPEVQKHYQQVCSVILEQWFKPNFLNLPNGTPTFFELIENGQTHYYKATPERIQIIFECLQKGEFDYIITGHSLRSGDSDEEEFIHVSGFGTHSHTHSVCSIL